ncbi:MAG: diaminopimelate decarboxylase [Bifidobacteriaceae bacterium]|jgi:diaminopimelate decarboxylase|nr:diaminopimelate decarboxylase [Bifidobacteriaceae bacterium]
MIHAHEAGARHGQGDAPAWLLVPDDVNALLPELWPSSVHKDEQGCLHVAGLSVNQIASQVGTPALVLDQADFLERARQFDQAFSQATGGRATVSYAAKALISKGIVEWVEQAGLGLDVCSEGELHVALRAGFPAGRITFHGNNKSNVELTHAVTVGVGRVVVDSLDEIERLESIAKAANVVVKAMIRVRIGVEAHTHEYIATAHEDQKFGISSSDGAALKAAQRLLDSPALDLVGWHCHIGSQVFDTAGYAETIRRLAVLSAELRQATGQQLPELCLGGGFGVAYTTGHDPLPPQRLAEELTGQLQTAFTEHGLAVPWLGVEPGRAIVGPAGFTIYTVGTIKPVALPGGFTRVYVSVDGGMSDNIRTALYSADYSATLASRRSSAAPVLARVVGKHCESGDIVVKDEYLPADLKAGDLLAVPVTGAYCYPLASNYNLVPRPPVVAVAQGQLTTLLRRETIDDLLARDCG